MEMVLFYLLAKFNAKHYIKNITLSRTSVKFNIHSRNKDYRYYNKLKEKLAFNLFKYKTYKYRYILDVT